MADHVDIHTVEAHAHGAPETGGAEGQLVVEAGLNLLFVAADSLQLGLLLVGQSGAGEPFFIFLHEIHMRFLLLY